MRGMTIRLGRFRDRDPLVLGAVGLVVLVATILALIVAPRVGGERYSAAFREAAGLEVGDDVRVAGVRVGAVTGLGLERGHVRVEFRVDADLRLGQATGAAIGIQSVLGRKYLALAPQGPGRLPNDEQIPLTRTASPYDVVEAVSGLSRTVGRLDAEGLATAFDTLSATSRAPRSRCAGRCAGCPGSPRRSRRATVNSASSWRAGGP